MNIEISTKFNIGDTIFISEYCNGEFYASMGYIVDWVGVRFERSGTIVEYGVRYGDITYDHLAEVSCFASYDECQAWCDKRNSNPGVTL